MNWHILMVLPLMCIGCNAYKVLILNASIWKSDFFFISTFVRALLNRGHEVTYLTSNTLNHLKLANYTEVLIDPPPNIISIFHHRAMAEYDENSGFSKFLADIGNMKMMTTSDFDYAYVNPNVQKFIKSTDLHFDVVVAEELFSEGLYMLAYKHKAPLVTISPMGNIDFIDRQHGLLNPPSFVPYHDFPYSDEMSFAERWHNTFYTMVVWMFRNFFYLPSQDKLAQKCFAHLAPLPPLRDILYNISINLVNMHRAISPPRPSMPSIIPIGGAHIEPIKPLPNDLKKFLDEAENGAIYFSLGSVVEGSQLPKQIIQSFLNIFKSLKQRVLWKFEDSLSDIPANIVIRKWMPQNDILAHSNVILFISHGGLLGSMESVYHGVPMLFIPFFGDQFRNAYRIEAAGHGKLIRHQDITEETFSKSIAEIMTNATFLDKAKERLAIFKDNLVHPMDEAMFWIEHVAKFKGAKHLKSHAVNMSWFTYLSLDVLLVNLLAVAAILFVLSILIKKLFSKCKNTAEPNLEKKRK